MAIKAQTDMAAALAAFKAKGGTVTKVASAAANATPLAVLRARAEANADAGYGYTAESIATGGTPDNGSCQSLYLHEMGFVAEANRRARGD